MKDRWQIELFFKALKQNLKIKTFVGTSANKVKIQIWIAMKRIGEVFDVSLSVVTKAALRISEQTKAQRRLKKETDQISYSIFKG